MSISIYSHTVWNIIYVFLLTNLNKTITDNQKFNIDIKQVSSKPRFTTLVATTFTKEINSDNVEMMQKQFKWKWTIWYNC